MKLRFRNECVKLLLKMVAQLLAGNERNHTKKKEKEGGIRSAIAKERRRGNGNGKRTGSTRREKGSAIEKIMTEVPAVPDTTGTTNTTTGGPGIMVENGIERTGIEIIIGHPDIGRMIGKGITVAKARESNFTLENGMVHRRESAKGACPYTRRMGEKKGNGTEAVMRAEWKR